MKTLEIVSRNFVPISRRQAAAGLWLGFEDGSLKTASELARHLVSLARELLKDREQHRLVETIHHRLLRYLSGQAFDNREAIRRIDDYPGYQFNDRTTKTLHELVVESICCELLLMGMEKRTSTDIAAAIVSDRFSHCFSPTGWRSLKAEMDWEAGRPIEYLTVTQIRERFKRRLRNRHKGVTDNTIRSYIKRHHLPKRSEESEGPAMYALHDVSRMMRAKGFEDTFAK